MTPTFDDDGYPTDETLEYICNFKGSNLKFFEYCEAAYNKHYGSWQIIEDYNDLASFNIRLKSALRITTGGWSGNEMILSAMAKNIIWNIHWIASFRGGLDIIDYSRIK